MQHRDEPAGERLARLEVRLDNVEKEAGSQGNRQWATLTALTALLAKEFLSRFGGQLEPVVAKPAATAVTMTIVASGFVIALLDGILSYI